MVLIEFSLDVELIDFSKRNGSGGMLVKQDHPCSLCRLFFL